MTRTEQIDLQGYAFIRNQVVHSGTIPSLREIGRAVGYNSPRSVQLMLERLKRRGLISYNDGVIKFHPRKNFSISEQTVDIPLVGSVACGLPSLAEQRPEAMIGVSTKIARPGHSYFLLRARGTSMNKSGIKPNDLLLVKQQFNAEIGEKVVALINDEATVKHFYPASEYVILKPNSTDPTHKPIVLSEEFSIQGVVTAVLPPNTY